MSEHRTYAGIKQDIAQLREIIERRESQAAATDGPIPKTSTLMNREEMETCLRCGWFLSSFAREIIDACNGEDPVPLVKAGLKTPKTRDGVPLSDCSELWSVNRITMEVYLFSENFVWSSSGDVWDVSSDIHAASPRRPWSTREAAYAEKGSA